MAINRSLMERQLYQQGGEAIYPRMDGLSSGISEAEQQLQQINQSIDEVQSNLGEGGGQLTQLPAGGTLATLAGFASQPTPNRSVIGNGFYDLNKGLNNLQSQLNLGQNNLSSIINPIRPGGQGSTLSSTYTGFDNIAGGDPRLGAPDVPNSLQQVMRGARANGGIMGLEPRQQYGLGSFVKKAVKGVTGAVKKIAKSDIGKAALLAAGGYYMGGGFGPGGFKLGNLPGGNFFGKGSLNPLLRKVGGDYAQSSFGSLLTGGGIPGASAVSKFVGDNAGMIGATVLGGVLGSLTPQEQEEISGSGGTNVEALRGKLTQAYRNLKYDEAEIPTLVANDLSEYTQDMNRTGVMYGGRMGYGDGTPYVEPDPAMMVDTTTFNPIPENADRQEAAEIAKVMMATRGLPREEGEIEDTETMSTEDFMLNEYFKPKREELMENFGLSLEEANNLIREAAIKIRGNRAEGGRMGYAFGTPEQNAIQAAGIEGLPLNQNPAGVTELDLRETGGFIPPVGVKEKADDIPAMLANNEFVFTADAVRGMGEGNVNKGAQRMYDMMKKLEKGGRV